VQGDLWVDDGCQVRMDDHCCHCHHRLSWLSLLVVAVLVVNMLKCLSIKCGRGCWCDKSCIQGQGGPPAVNNHGGDHCHQLLGALHNSLRSLEY